jgi:hypothetical protein
MMPVETSATLLSFMTSIPHVWSYLDPGAGSMMLQVLLAGMLSSAFFVKTWIRQLREGLLTRHKKA